MQNRLARLLTMLAALLLIPAVLIVFAFILPPQYTETFPAGYARKLQTLQETEGPRVILVGGSGTAFAVRSDLLEQALPGYRVINLGLYAGLGSTAPLEAAAPELREGDIVVFMPEQNSQTLSLYFGSSAMWQAADGHWPLLSTVRRENLGAMMGQFPYFAVQKAVCFFQHRTPHGDGIYAASSFNRWGDIESPLRDHCALPDTPDPSTAISFAPDLPDADFTAYINRYAESCRRKGVRFYFGFCPMNADHISGSEQTGVYTARLRSLLSCPLLGTPEDSMLEAGWFFDTDFHLNSAGAIVFTDRLARLLQPLLEVEGEAAFPLPEMPGTFSVPYQQGDDSDADCFLYQITGSTACVTGLTEEGAARTRLTLPSFHHGLPVTGLTPDTFAGNTVLEALTLQPNLGTIPDGAFDGCTHLKHLILSGVSPSSCPVNSGLLKGTDAQIEVDADLLAAYQTNYFWAVHADRIHARETAAPADTPVLPQQADSHAESSVSKENAVCFVANGGQVPQSDILDRLELPVSEAHLRTNTPAYGCFVRPGYRLIGWSPQADGSGDLIGLGSRWALQGGEMLYAVWLPETPADAFSYEISDQGAWITGLDPTVVCCVLPETLGGLPVIGIRSGALADTALDRLVLSPVLETIEPGALARSALRELVLYDTLLTVSDDAFEGCDRLTTLRVNAASAPVYSTSYYATFADKYDWLLSLKGQKKLVLFSGSSTRYGYDSQLLYQSYPDWMPANMGVYAYTNALPQLELILPLMESGDVLLHAPEFDCTNFQLCETNRLDFHFWAMMEASYDCVSRLDLRGYSRIFDSLQTYLTIRRDLPGLTYEHSPNGYDDDGNNMRQPTYNRYGDLIMPRANNKIDIMLKFVRAVYTPEPFTDALLEAINTQYRRFQDQGITVLFTYTPRNRSSISQDSTPENRKALDQRLRASLCVPVISRIEDSLISGVYFFVIDSHLSNEGARLHTLQIIEDLKPWLKD